MFKCLTYSIVIPAALIYALWAYSIQAISWVCLKLVEIVYQIDRELQISRIEPTNHDYNIKCVFKDKNGAKWYSSAKEIDGECRYPHRNIDLNYSSGEFDVYCIEKKLTDDELACLLFAIEAYHWG